MKCEVSSEVAMRQLGEKLGRAIATGGVVELVGDVGAGKTTLTKGIAEGLGVSDPVQSPTFSISRVYETSGGSQFCHYDFYRLPEAGIMADELDEVMSDDSNVVVVEWADSVNDVLPADRLKIVITTTAETDREVEIFALGESSAKVLGALAC